MKARDYLPNLYQSNLEMNATVKSYEDELDLSIKPNIDTSFNNQFPIIADEDGISNYEKIFNIKVDPATEDLELRRSRIMNRLISHTPFTERFLQQKLNSILGEDNWNYELNYNNYTLTINVTTPGKTWLRELQLFLDNTIPCNIVWQVNIYQASWRSIKENFATWDDLKTYTWQEILDGDWI